MLSVRPIDFMGQGALLEPADRKLHAAALEYCWANLTHGQNLNFSKFAKVWVGLKDDQVLGIAGYVLRPDVPLLRATDAEVLRALARRLNDFFADQGCRGQDAFLFIGREAEHQRCPEWRQVLKEFGAKAGQRFLVEVR